MIKCLPTEVQGKLRSGVAVPSLQQCVEELLLNSIDAGATCVGVRMDLEAFKVQVIDNGSGMAAEDMECVGIRYHTSKCGRVEDLENLRSYGFRGEALASVVSLATLVEISSRTRLSVKTHVKLFRNGQAGDVFEAETPRPSAGTTVIVCNFFHNMPVRRKRVDAVLEGERIRHRVEAVSLMHPSISFTLKNDCTGVMMVQLPKARDTYHRFVQIHSLARAEKLEELKHMHKQFEVTGYLGKERHYNGSLQYLFVNDRLLLKTQIHKLLSCLLRRPSTSNHNQDGTSVIPGQKHKRNQDQYGVYIINIKCSYSEYDVCVEPAKTLVEFKDWDGVLVCVEEAVKGVLRREDFVSVFSQKDPDSPSPKAFGAGRTDRKEETEMSGQEGVSASTLDCGVGVKLASGFVHRGRADNGVCPESDPIESGADEARQHEQMQPASAMIQVRQTMAEAADNLDCEIPKVQQTPHSSCDSFLTISHNSTRQLDLNCNEQILLCPGRKIRLSDPYVHQSLQTRDLSHSDEPHGLNRDEKFVSLKHKRPLEPNWDGGSAEQRRDATAVVPLKIPKVNPVKKLAFHQPGSLDKFRLTYSKSLKGKPECAKSQNDSHFPHTLSFAPDSFSAFKESTQHQLTDSQNKDKAKMPFPKPTLTTNYKRNEISLAAKLCGLKQQMTEDFKVSQHMCQGSLEDQNVEDASQESGCKHQLDVDEDASACSDWLHHYESSVGKTVYINKKTGLSKYEEPASVETRAMCTSDVSNMAVSVISEMDDGDNEESSNSLSLLYSKWKNPVFVRPHTVGVDISNAQADGLAVKIHNILFPYRFSKNMIQSMKVVNQVDKKFLACLINTRDDDSASVTETDGNLLVLVDQHAAHERVRLEHLVADSYEDDTVATGGKCLRSSTISPPLEISVTEEELRLLRSSQLHLNNLGLEVRFSQTGAPKVFVGKVPLCFLERESNQRKRGRPSIIEPIVEEYLREQTELLRLTGRVGGTLPLTVLKVLASLACHGAVKFNQALSRDECRSLVACLSSCQLPFQCAHGRPSIAPLVDVLHLDKDQKDIKKPNLQKLRRMYRAWELYGNK